MDPNEVRYRLTASLLQAEGPLTLAELAERSGLGARTVRPVLKQLVAENQVAEGELVPGKPGPHYAWGARWAKVTGRRATDARQELLALVAPLEARWGRRLALEGEPALAFHDFVIRRYQPPPEKRFLVFFQCSVRRPFYSSPSHGTIRRAIQTATGCDAYHDFESCPVHVVVLASMVGPVPYELQDVYPANVSAGGVKHFRPDYYEQVKPVLAGRMADYITAHGRHYEHMATFTDGRYGEVMVEATRIAGADVCVLPDRDGPIITSMGGSKPRTYWQKHWIQLYLEIVSWLAPAQQAEAAARLRDLRVAYR